MSLQDPLVEALQARAQTRIGQVLRQKWRLDKLLGLGGMAAVYAATHVHNGRRVAIKWLHLELSHTPEVCARFLREGYLANQVDHPGTVAVLDNDVSDDGAAFLVMELLEGETLEDRRARTGVLPLREVLALADRVLDVLAAAHQKGIVHRDLKPENVFLTRDGTVKVLDFGIAKMRAMQGARLTIANGGAIGTPAFMPPEQARGRWDDVGPPSDIWSVGATMFTLLAGQLVHRADTMNELLLAAMTQPAPAMASVLPALPPPVAQLIDRALAYDLRARWPDARTMQGALRTAYQSIERTSLPSPRFSVDVIAPAPSLLVSSSPPPPPQGTVPVLGVSGASGATGYARRRSHSAVPVVVGALVGALLVGSGVWALLTLRTSRAGSESTPVPIEASSTPAQETFPPPVFSATVTPAATLAAPDTVMPVPSAIPTSKPVGRPARFLLNPRRSK